MHNTGICMLIIYWNILEFDVIFLLWWDNIAWLRHWSRGLRKFLWLFWTHVREGPRNSVSSVSHSVSKHHFLRINSFFIDRMKLFVHKCTIVTEPYFSRKFPFGPNFGKTVPKRVKMARIWTFSILSEMLLLFFWFQGWSYSPIKGQNWCKS